MSVSQLVGTKVHVLISDPWEFGTECGVGPFTAVVTAAEPDRLLLRLEAPIEYRSSHLQTILVTARHSPGTVEPLATGRLSANMAFLRVPVVSSTELDETAKAGMVAAIGSIELSSS